ncbi:MAG TPA: patatin-like phospholipase family protein [Geminicoccaceae bacterium]|nr:patatin-like phospholipase family protein [Geminicoccaceae bacterium]
MLPRSRAGRLGLSLALQGGGAHGAFTWGVLDRLLEEETIDIEAVSGTSAGAINAVALASGWCQGGREGARATLERLWRAVGREAARPPLGHDAFTACALGLATHLFSPYELNPLDIKPLRELLDELVDFAALRACRPMPILVAATRVRTGECRIFREHELTAETVLASACLPQLFQAIEIDGEAYWDGGYTSNPPVLELAKLGRSKTLLVVRINPADGEGSPRSAPAIRNRTAEIVFGRPLAIELAQLDKLRGLGRDLLGSLQPQLRRLARVDVQIIDGGETLARLDPTTKLVPDTGLLEHLRADGRAAAEAWLRRRAGPTATASRGLLARIGRQEARTTP